jgi:hypothetical protein
MKWLSLGMRQKGYDVLDGENERSSVVPWNFLERNVVDKPLGQFILK